MLRNSTRHVCSGRRKRLAVGLASCGLICLFAPAAEGAQPGLSAVVAIRNYAGLTQETLDIAESQASRVFERAGVTIEWRQLPRSQSADVDLPVMVEAIVNLLPDSMIPPLHPSPEAFGKALGLHAYVFAGRIRQATEAALISFPKILGHIMAHELGHVLLGENSHAHQTIMSPRLGTREFQRMEMGNLLFSQAQAEKLRERIRAQQAAETAVVGAQK